MKTIFEKSKKGKQGFIFSELDVPDSTIGSELLRQADFVFPELSEPEVVQHYIALSRRTHGLDEKGLYPLGSCTMKYNPVINEKCAALPGFLNLHPLEHKNNIQGALKLIYDFEKILRDITGFDAFSLQPAAGAQAEFTALLMIKMYLAHHGETKRNKVLIPKTAHGTNPASVRLVGWEAVEFEVAGGIISIEELKAALNNEVACIMITNPNTLGLFEKNIVEINRLVHEAGAFSYLDGANFNALIGRYLPREQGFDLMHLNLHKTFSTPHGGGGPGAGALGVIKKFEPFLPLPTVRWVPGYVPDINGGYKMSARKFYYLDFNQPLSMGKLSAFWGNFLIIVRAYAYMLALGNDTYKVSAAAIANAHYLKDKLSPPYEVPFAEGFLHEFVISCEKIQKETGVNALNIAKRLMDFGFHPPTMYFPLTVHEALMIEPTETASREALDEFVTAMLVIHEECYKNPEIVKTAPNNIETKRVDEVKAARDAKVNFF